MSTPSSVLRLEDREYLSRSRAASGVPEKVRDLAAISRLVSLVLPTPLSPSDQRPPGES